jgi:hypothetical protein
MDRMELRLQQARRAKNEYLSQIAMSKLAKLERINPAQSETLKQQFAIDTAAPSATALELKDQNKVLKNLIVAIKKLLNEERIQELLVIQRACKSYLAHKAREQIKSDEEKEYFLIVDQVSPEPGPVAYYLKQLDREQRLGIKPWKEYLKNKNSSPEARSSQNSETGFEADKKLELEIECESVEHSSPESMCSDTYSTDELMDLECLSDEEKEQDNSVSAHFLINLMSHPTINFYCVLVLFVALTSCAMGLCGMASIPMLSTSAVTISSSVALILGLGFFSQSIKAPVLDKPDEEQGYLNKSSANGQ